MSDLRPPLREYLPLPVDEVALARMRGGIDLRRRRRRRNRFVMGGAMVTASVAAALALGLLWTRGTAEPGPLRLTDGRLPRLFETPAEGPALSRSDLDDGSVVAVRAGTRVRVVANDGRRFDLRLERGTSRIHVKPGGRRTWVIRCDPVRVEVLGTRLSVECTPAVARIRVTESRVRVTGGTLPSEGVIVTAGEQLEVRRVVAAPPSPGPVPPPDRERSTVRTGPPSPAPRPLPSRPAPAVSPAEAVRVLMSGADTARRAGRHAEAAALLDRIVRDHPTTPEAPLAAFMRGRLLADRLGRPAEAAAAFDRAIELGLPAALAEDARARVVEAWAHAGQRARAVAALEDLRVHHPASPRVRDAERWIEAIGTR